MHNFIMLESNIFTMPTTCPSCGTPNDERAYCVNCNAYLYAPSYKNAEDRVNRQRHIGGD